MEELTCAVLGFFKEKINRTCLKVAALRDPLANNSWVPKKDMLEFWKFSIEITGLSEGKILTIFLFATTPKKLTQVALKSKVKRILEIRKNELCCINESGGKN